MHDIIKKTPQNKRAGFNLIEVSLAVFVMSIGLLALFALFPTGLGMADTARRETQGGMFADYVFSALRARADHTDPKTWLAGDTAFRNTMKFNDSPFIKTESGGAHWVEHRPDEELVRFPAHTEGTRHQTYLRYSLELYLTNSAAAGAALLKIRPGRSGGRPSVFYTEFYPFQEVAP